MDIVKRYYYDRLLTAAREERDGCSPEAAGEVALYRQRMALLVCYLWARRDGENADKAHFRQEHREVVEAWAHMVRSGAAVA